MKVGDLVELNPAKLRATGTLDVVKTFGDAKRKSSRVIRGIVTSVSEFYCSILFGENVIRINKEHVEVINENR